MAEHAIRYERLEHVTWERREWHPVGETRDEMAECMAWVIALGHEAKSLEDDGFRYRSVYRGSESAYITRRNAKGIQCSGWLWAEPGEWLMHMVGENQDSELDSPHDSPPDTDDGWGLPRGGWHRVADQPATTPTEET